MVNIKLSSDSFQRDDEIMAEIRVTNTGQYDGTETVQLYIRDLVASVTRPVKELKDFKQVFLKPGESRTVNFMITEEDLKYYNEDLKFIAEPGEFKLFIGTNSQDVKETSFTLE